MLLFDKDLESFPGLSFNLVPIAQSYCLTRDWTKMSTRCQLVSFSGGTKIKKYVRSERMAINSCGLFELVLIILKIVTPILD